MPGLARQYRLGTSMVRRGSTVRVRQRASNKSLQTGFFIFEALHEASAIGQFGDRFWGQIWGSVLSQHPDHYVVRNLRRFASAAFRAASISASMFSGPLPS